MDNEVSYTDLYKVGDHLLIQLTDQDVLQGQVASVSQNIIDITQLKHQHGLRNSSGVYSFSRYEIQSIKLVKPKEHEKSSIEESDNQIESISKLKLNDSEFDRIRDMIIENVYLEKADSRYFEGVGLLSRAENVGIVGLGLEHSRSDSLKLLAVCSWDKVYLFDMVNQKQSYFYPELKEILEADYICKVMHGGGPLLDILYRQYKVYVRNTFDTQVVDMVIKKKQNGTSLNTFSDLSMILTDYLNFPKEYLRSALETSNKKWKERPLSDRRKEYAAQLVAYLLTVKDTMLKSLFSEIYSAINNVHEFYYNLDDFHFSKYCFEKTIPKDIQDIIPNVNVCNNE